MRTGGDYRKALRDGRKVWVMGEGWVDDVTTHPATRAMVEEYALWYDRHLDPAWQELLLAPPNAHGARNPWAYVLPRSADDLIGMGRSFARTTFLSAGNITHTPAYGNLIAMGVLTAAQTLGASQEHIAEAIAYRELIARTGRFLTYCGGAPIIGQRMRQDPRDRVALKLVREKDAGVVIRGKLGMHTSPAYAEDVYVGAMCGIEIGGHRASFIVPVGAPGVTTLCRKVAVRDANPFVAPLSSRYDELDGQMWLDDVFIPWERVFFVDPSPEAIARWLRWHHLYGWLSKAEFTLGVALALADAMGLKAHEQTIEYLVDLIAEVQTVRSCLTAAERDNSRPRGIAFPVTRIWRPAASPSSSRVNESLRSCGFCRAPRSLSHPPTATSLRRNWPRGSRNLSAAAAIPHCSARRCCNWRGITSPLPSMLASRRSSCTPAMACPTGAAGCAAISRITIRWPMRSCARSICRCRQSI
jgi:aromatic ring hydroxylase